jgi:cytochrome c-type biogenesis protein
VLNTANILIVSISALIIGLNPYTIGVLVLLSTVSLGSGHPARRMLILGGVYTMVIFAASLIIGMAWLYALNILPAIAASYTTLGIALIAISAGLLDIKSYFWYDKDPITTMPQVAMRNIRKLTRSQPEPLGAATLGSYVAVVAAPSNLISYLALLAILGGGFSGASISLVATYNLIFVLPLVTLLQLAANGTRLSIIQRWKENNKHRMRLAKGLLAIALGWTLMLVNSGVLNFG